MITPTRNQPVPSVRWMWFALLFIFAFALTGCGSDDSISGRSSTSPPSTGGGSTGSLHGSFKSASIQVASQPKEFQLDWQYKGDVDHFVIEVNPDHASGYAPADVNGDGKTDAGDWVAGTARQQILTLPLHLFLFNKASYRLVAYSASGTSVASSNELFLNKLPIEQAIGYLPKSGQPAYGSYIAFSRDGSTLAVSADNDVDIYRRSGGDWKLVKTFNLYGGAVALSADGNTLAIAIPIYDGPSGNNMGKVLLYAHDASGWTQQDTLTASNADKRDKFGHALAFSDNGDVLYVGAAQEDSGDPGNPADNSQPESGAVYRFTRDPSGTWTQQAYIKAPSHRDSNDRFGEALAVSSDGTTLAVGTSQGGEVYVRSGNSPGTWTYIRPTQATVLFGRSVALSLNGDTLVVGDEWANNDKGAVFVFTHGTGGWTRQAILTASNADKDDHFGASVALSADGDILVVSAPAEDSAATGINGRQSDNSAKSAGAVYVFVRERGNWSQRSYVKASHKDPSGCFGISVVLSGSGRTLAVGAPTIALGTRCAPGRVSSGAVYLY